MNGFFRRDGGGNAPLPEPPVYKGFRTPYFRRPHEHWTAEIRGHRTLVK